MCKTQQITIRKRFGQYQKCAAAIKFNFPNSSPIEQIAVKLFAVGLAKTIDNTIFQSHLFPPLKICNTKG